jgi:hypothetical protein
MLLTRLWPNGGPSAVLNRHADSRPSLGGDRHAAEADTPSARTPLTSGSAAAGAKARGVGRFSWCLRIQAANCAIGSGLPRLEVVHL